MEAIIEAIATAIEAAPDSDKDNVYEAITSYRDRFPQSWEMMPYSFRKLLEAAEKHSGF